MRLCNVFLRVMASVLVTICALSMLLLSSGFALASPLTGIWSDGSCRFTDRTKIISDAGIIDIIDLGQGPVVQIVQTVNVVFSNNRYFARGMHPLFPQPLNIQLSLENERILGQYRRCESLPAELAWMIGEPMSFFIGAEETLGVCKSGNDEECFKSAFDLVDVYDDDKLSVAEVSRFLRTVAFFSSYYASNSTQVRLETTIGTMAVSSFFSPMFASSVVSGSDYNADGLLGIDEILIDREVGGLSSSVTSVRVGAVNAMSDIMRPLLSSAATSLFSNPFFR